MRVDWLRESPVQEGWGIQASYQCAVKFCLGSSIDLIFPFLTIQKKKWKKKRNIKRLSLSLCAGVEAASEAYSPNSVSVSVNSSSHHPWF